jgi:ATP-dependent exoDNAse (exonuclease V) alpha subunit
LEREQFKRRGPRGPDRAAKRMTETTGREAKTLHRLLEFDPKTMSFLRDRQRPREADLVIVSSRRWSSS